MTEKLILPPNLRADLLGALIEVGAIDGKSEERVAVKADRDGRFAFKTRARRVKKLRRPFETIESVVCRHFEGQISAEIHVRHRRRQPNVGTISG